MENYDSIDDGMNLSKINTQQIGNNTKKNDFIIFGDNLLLKKIKEN